MLLFFAFFEQSIGILLAIMDDIAMVIPYAMWYILPWILASTDNKKPQNGATVLQVILPFYSSRFTL